MNKPFLHRVAEDIHKRFDDNLADVAIIFNNKRPITYLKKHLADVYGKAIWSPHFFTIQEFFKLASDRTEASQLTQFFYLFQLHNELLAAEGAESETLEEFYPIAEIILSDFGELDYELVDIDHIYMELYDTTKIDIAFQHFTAEQQHFIRQFWQSFSISGHSGLQQRFLKLWNRLPKLYKAFKQKLAEEKQLNYPTLYRHLVEGHVTYPHFIQQYKKVLFVGFNALNKAEVLLFQKWQKEGRALFYFDTDTYYMDDLQQEAGLFVRRNIKNYGLHDVLGESLNIIGTRETPVHIYACNGKNSQTKILHDVLESSIATGKSAAILLADEQMLVPLLQSLPDVKPNITTGYPLTQSPLYGLLNLWLDVQEAVSHHRKLKIPFQYVETFVNHPLTSVSPSEKQAILKEISDKQLMEIDMRELTIASSVFPNFFKPLSDASTFIPTIVHLLDHILSSIAVNNRIGQIDSNLIIETKKVLNQLKHGLDSIAPSSITFQIGLIRKAIAPINSAIEGDPLNGLQIMGLLESRCLNFDQVYILGANEGILPKTSSSPTFLPNSLRKAYDLPVTENQDALSAYLFYRHFQYSDDIHLFYNSFVDENSSGEESRFIKQLQFESNFHFIIHQQQQPIHFPKSGKELIIPKTGAIWSQLWDTFVVGKKRLSATALTSYLQSPLQFFLKYIAEIKEPPNISHEFEMNRLGTVIHNVMETILKPYKGLADFTSTSVLKTKFQKIDVLVAREIGVQYYTEIESTDMLNSMQRIMHKIASEYVRMYIQYDIDNYVEFKIIELENDEDYTLDFPIKINDKVESIKLYGIIDRVDQVVSNDGEIKTRIVDYKTGGDSVTFKSLDKVFSSNTENKAFVQTLFYTYIFEQKSTFKNLEPHLYVARRMREEGTLFHNRQMVVSKETLVRVKEEFITFLRTTLEEIFDQNIPFKHNTEMTPYENDPYLLFYKNALKNTED